MRSTSRAFDRSSSILTSLGCTVKSAGRDGAELKYLVELLDRHRRDRFFSTHRLDPLGRRGRRRLSRFLESPVEELVELLKQGLSVLDRDVAGVDESLHVELADRSHLIDQLVHQRLGIGRLVPFVVPAAPITDHVDHDIAVEGLAEGKCQAGHTPHRLGVVAVDMDDREPPRSWRRRWHRSSSGHRALKS